LFGKLKAQVHSATLSRKVVGIAGDVTMPHLGLSASNRQLLIDRVSSIFHAAATIRFDEPLNTRGAKLKPEHAQDMQELEVWPRCSYNPIR
jgi:fatty acyl-CoA reductase